MSKLNLESSIVIFFLTFAVSCQDASQSGNSKGDNDLQLSGGSELLLAHQSLEGSSDNEDVVSSSSGSSDSVGGGVTEDIGQREIIPQDSSDIYLDFLPDENGFGPWKLDNYKSSNMDDYTRGAITRCHNGTTIQSRECFAKDDPSKCLGVIEKEEKKLNALI
jgi:hypothetical protein